MRDAVIVAARRSPVTKRKGALAGLHPADLAAQVLSTLVADAGVDPTLIDDVILGCVSQAGEQTGDIARTAVISAGWPLTIPGVTIDRQCGSSQQSVHFAAAGLVAGQYDVVVAGGVESMTRVPMFSAAMGESPYGTAFMDRIGVVPNQGIGAEMIAEQWRLSRTQLDEFALASHAKAAAAIDAGAFDEEIVPIQAPDGTVVTRDEGVRRGGTLESLGALDTVFKEDGVITAGNASQISDGASAVLMMTSEKARELGLTPLARVHTAVLAGSDPVIMLTGPIPATEKLLAKSGVPLAEIGTYEVNEAFASVPLAWAHDVGADPARLNPEGGAIALGHPLGATGTRLLTSMVHRMRREGVRYGLQTMCEGGGQANAALIEAV